MKILHVSLANPKTHHGGLNRYCTELMNQEKKLGNEVMLLYPGNLKSNGYLTIKRHDNNYYSINGALPVAITYGIDNPQRYMNPVDMDVYRNWLRKIKPDIIHIHSVQGIHKEFFKAAKEMNISMVYTTHDYCMVCPKCTLIDWNNKPCEEPNADRCARCNYLCGFSERKQKVLQSVLYQMIKENTVIKFIKHKFMKHSKKDCQICTIKQEFIDIKMVDDFEKLRKYYSDIFAMFDVVHCNSEIAMGVYSKAFPKQNYKVIPITHEGLTRTVHVKNDSIYRIAYMGGENYYKGYFVLEKVILLLEQSDFGNWKINFYGSEFHKNNTKQKYYKGYFSPNQEAEVWNNIDIVVVPSQWKETFGFIVLEALCRGIPVICSDLVGSKDLVQNIDDNLVFQHDKPEELYSALIYLMNDSRYKEITRKINGMKLDYDMEQHAREIVELYNFVNLNED